ncbi:ras guanine nucleotide exchange factor B-like isoform X2 [Nymphalis io]|uniref:ras guanine nucleotide exchange factor B-like isoform X2 n=1 Tax=Inachis io TaxID=171585 RepID=UPI002169B60D|nr:ras guanine nucleotide exchange factor B-like isoform X2 [Nymphalis io]
MNNFYCVSTVDGDKLKGINLREKKIKLRPMTSSITDIDFGEPSCSNTNRWHNLERNHERDFSREYGFSRNPKGTVYKKHNIRDHTGVRKTRKKNPSRRAKTRCPMRVLELSVPTKRHCLETWRTNRDILPNFMVERLRRIVMDEKPIVKIYDAIDCFKRQKSTNRLSSKRHVKTKHQDQMKLFCGLLSYKVIQKLQRPLNLTLDSHLKTLSQVVNEDITNILYDPKKTGLYTNTKIQTEIADTVTIWITSILEESANKILMEEFQELKEIEGPVWDLIDQLIDNVAVACEPVTIVSSSVSQLSTLSVSKSVMNENLNLVIDSPSKNNNSEINTNSMDNQQVKNSDSILAYILDNIAYNEEALSTLKDIANSNEEDGILDTNNNNNENNDKNVTASNVSLNENNLSNHRFNKNDVDIVQESTSNEIDSHNANNIDNDRTNSDVSDITKQLDITATVDDEVLKIIKTSTEIKHNINVNSTDNNVLSNGSQEVQTTPDDSIKKVKFSNLNIGAYNRKTGISDDSDIYIREGHYDMPINLSEDGTLKHELHLAPPNDNLLSDADESWPENLHFPVLKATVSVSKSILSLGNILENEEKELTTDDRSNISNNDRKSSITQTIQADKKEEIDEGKRNIEISTNEKYPTENCTNTKNKYYEPNNYMNLTQKQILETDDTSKKENIAVKLIIEHMPIITINPKEYINYNIHETAIQTEQEVLNNVVEQNLSAVNILTSCKINEESKEISCGTFVKGYNIKEFEVRKWCHGLENVTQNLELWIDWMEITCNYIMSIKYKANKRREDKYLWTKLVINIDLDSKTWRKIGKKLRRGIINYKSYYVKSRTRQTKSCNNHQLLQISQLCQKERTCTCKQGLHDL